MGFFKVEQKANELAELRRVGWVKGTSTGFANLDEIFTLKSGYPLFIAGAPHAGKTEIVLEILLNTSVLHGWKHFIYLGEGGEVEEVIAELCHKYIAKPFKSGAEYSMSEAEKVQAEMFINEHFIFLDDSGDYTLTQFFELAQAAQDEFMIKFNTTCFDPFNDIVDESAKFGGRDDKWLAHELKLARRSSKKHDRIDILVNHISDIHPVLDKDTNKRYIPPALPSEWAGGRTWWRRAFGMVLIYRPPQFLKDEHGVQYKQNETHFIVQKAKPKGIGKLGFKSLFFDWKMNRYFWVDDYDKPYFAFETNKKKELQPLTRFEDESAPF